MPGIEIQTVFNGPVSLGSHTLLHVIVLPVIFYIITRKGYNHLFLVISLLTRALLT